MKIRFLRDYRGVHTGEQFHAAGEEIDSPSWDLICQEGAAVIVDTPQPEPEPEPDAPTITPARRGK